MKKTNIFNNFGLKILAVLISILLWIAVINVSDPVTTSTYTDIPVIVTNTEAITSEGKVYELTSESTVSISVSAKRSIQDYLSEDNFKAVVDLENYDEETGSVPIRIESNKYSGQIESMKSKTEVAIVSIEDMLRKQFVITPVVTGEPEEGYVVGNVSTAENIVRISGAESVVSSIKKVTAEMTVTGLASDVNTSVDLKLLDENGEQIKDSNLTKNISTVAMSAQILATKELPIRFTTSGTPKDGYGISGSITSDKQTVVVAGKPSVLANLQALDISPAAVKIDGADKTAEVEVDLTRYMPEGLSVVDAEDNKIVMVNVPIDEIISKEYEIPLDAIKMTGLSAAWKTEIIDSDEVIRITTKGFSKQVRGMLAKDIELSVDWEDYIKANDIQQLKETRYRVPVVAQLPEGVTMAEVSVLVELTEIE